MHLRADQNPILIKQYWSKELNIPLENFTSISVDKRTIGSSTYPTYNGVCVLRCGNIAIQRRLLYLARNFCKEIANRAVSSVGRASAWRAEGSQVQVLYRPPTNENFFHQTSMGQNFGNFQQHRYRINLFFGNPILIQLSWLQNGNFRTFYFRYIMVY